MIDFMGHKMIESSNSAKHYSLFRLSNLNCGLINFNLRCRIYVINKLINLSSQQLHR